MQNTEKLTEIFSSFALNLMKTMPEGENIIISPVSILTVLALCISGTKGESKRQLLSLFGGMDEDEINSFMQRAEDILSGDNVLFGMANGLFVNDECITLKENFVRTAENIYDAEVSSVDLSKEESLEKINGWVKEKTNGLIDKITDEDISKFVMLIINALAFDGKWMEPFDPYKSFGGVFYGNTPQGAELMNSTENAYFTVSGGAGFVKPYFGGYSFAAILPDEGVSVKDIYLSLSADELIGIMTGAQPCRVDITFPELDLTTEHKLKDHLVSLGISDIFDGFRADFSDMCAEAVYADDLIHKCTLKVDEDGTKAAAVSSMGIMRMSAAPPAKHHLIFDRPFMFMIFREETKIPVFMGAVSQI